MQYKISVIIPVYNAENDVKSAIDSIINQTMGFEYIELIIVDDASTDNTKQIIKNYQKKYDNIILIELTANSGLPGKPRSIGLDYVSSKYIIFLDADDAYEKEAFEILYDAIEKEDSDIVISSHYLNLDGEMIKATLTQSNEDIVSFKPLESQKDFDATVNLIAPWGKIFKKELIVKNNIRFLEDSLCEDAYFYLKALINSKKITILRKKYLYVYNTFENKNTAIHKHDLEKFNNFLKGMYSCKNLLKDIDLSANVFFENNIASLLLIFSNLNKKDKKQAVLEIYEFEKDLNVQIRRKEVKILNNLILKKKFGTAILISNLYSFIYNNSVIKKMYRKLIYK